MKDLDLLRNRIIALERNDQALGDTLNQVQRERDDLLAEVARLRRDLDYQLNDTEYNKRLSGLESDNERLVIEVTSLRRKVAAAESIVKHLEAARWSYKMRMTSTITDPCTITPYDGALAAWYEANKL